MKNLPEGLVPLTIKVEMVYHEFPSAGDASTARELKAHLEEFLDSDDHDRVVTIRIGNPNGSYSRFDYSYEGDA